MSRDKVSEKVQKVILDKLRSGTIPWSHPVQMGKAVSWVTGKSYQGVNAWILPPGEYLTFSQIKQNGGKVIKGSKSFPAIYWNVIDSKTETERKVINGVEREVPKKVFIMRYYNLFEVSQCEGINYRHNKDSYYKHDHENSKVTENLDEKLKLAETIIETFKYKPEYNTELHIKTPCYIPSLDRIDMPKVSFFNSLERYYSTFFHELTHATGSSDRLNREGVANFQGKMNKRNYSYEELVAEMGASIMSGYIGFSDEIYEASASYIEGWLSVLSDDIGMLISASSKANEAFNYILDNSAVSKIDEAVELGDVDKIYDAIKKDKLSKVDNLTTIMLVIYLKNNEEQFKTHLYEQIGEVDGKDEEQLNTIKERYSEYLDYLVREGLEKTRELKNGELKTKSVELFNFLNTKDTQIKLINFKEDELTQQYNRLRELFSESTETSLEGNLAEQYSKQLQEFTKDKTAQSGIEAVPLVLANVFVLNNHSHLGRLLAIKRMKDLNTDVTELKDKKIYEDVALRTYQSLLKQSVSEYEKLKKEYISDEVSERYILTTLITHEGLDYLKSKKAKSMKIHYNYIREYLNSEIQKSGLYGDDEDIIKYVEELRKITTFYANRANGLQSEIIKICYLESEQSKYYYEGLIVPEIAYLKEHPLEFDRLKKEHGGYLEFVRSEIKYEGSLISHELGQVEQVLVQFVKSPDIREHLKSTEVLTKYTDNRELINYIKELYIKKNPSQQYDGENEYEHYLGQLINIAKYYAKTQEHNVIRELFTVMYLREEQAFVYRIYVDEILSYLYLPNEVELVQSVINKFKDKVERFIEELYDYNITKMAQWRVNFMDIEDVLSSQKFKELSKGNMYIRLRDLYADIESLIKGSKASHVELTEQDLKRLERFKPLIESYEELLTRVKSGRSNMDLPLGFHLTRLPKSNPVIHVKLSRSNKGEPISIAFNPREYYISEGKSFEKKIIVQSEHIQYLNIFQAFIQQHVLPLNPNIDQLKYLMKVVQTAYDLRRKV